MTGCRYASGRGEPTGRSATPSDRPHRPAHHPFNDTRQASQLSDPSPHRGALQQARRPRCRDLHRLVARAVDVGALRVLRQQRAQAVVDGQAQRDDNEVLAVTAALTLSCRSFPSSKRQDSRFHLFSPAKSCATFGRIDRTQKRVGRATTLKCPRLGCIADDARGNRHLHCRQVHCLGSLMVTLRLFSAAQSFQHSRPSIQADNHNCPPSDSTAVGATR